MINNYNERTKMDAKKLTALIELLSDAHPTTETDSPWKVGANYFFRTVTFFYTGKLVAVTPQELVIENAAWIADTGRFTQALENCDFDEVEIYPAGPVIIGRAAVVDALEIKTLPSVQK